MTKTGADIFAASLPPRSTRNLPKRRWCQLLKGIEECRPQSLYSDVLEFMYVNGKKQSDGKEKPWKTGAGGG